MIQIQDNFFSESAFKQMQSILMSDRFNWFWNEHMVDLEDESEDTFQFTHTFYNERVPISELYINLPEELFTKLRIVLLILIKANLTTRTPEQELSEFHVDHDIPNALTSIYYVNSNNGCTVFEETGEKVESVQNRMITFPSNLRHATLSHTDTKRRVLLNINYTTI